MASETALTSVSSRKRKPSDDLSDQQRLAKRFDLLNIDNENGKLYIPVSPSSHPSTSARDGLDGDRMELEDSKHKVYIYDLDKELEGCESDEEKPIFIPDIEKHLNKLPRVVLIGDDAREAAKNMQMVLYSLPTSLTVPEEQDSVRKAILESRKRMRDRQGLTVPPVPKEHFAPAKGNGVASGQTDVTRGQSAKLRDSNALQVPATPPEYLFSKATINGYNNDGHDADVMEMEMD